MTEKTTEKQSHYDHLEKMPVKELLASINREDKTVPEVISQSLIILEKAVTVITEKMKAGGRLFY
ncbi:MAG: N-acetylmuramic acid 6-phosphate etherase, partial [Bacteroidota bacterium]